MTPELVDGRFKIRVKQPWFASAAEEEGVNLTDAEAMAGFVNGREGYEGYEFGADEDGLFQWQQWATGKGRWEVAYRHRSVYEGIGSDDDAIPPERPREQWPRTRCRTWIGADFYRRFRYRPFTLGMRWVETAIVPAGADFDTRQHEPRYAVALERWLWRPLYWLRNRWDGLRYGLIRDERRW